MNAVMYIYNPKGVQIGAVEGFKTIWRDVPFNSTMSTQVSIAANKIQPDWIQFGNLWVVESDTGAEMIGGVIRGPQSWKEGSVDFTIRSWEQFLKLPTSPVLAFHDKSIGKIAEGLMTDLLQRYKLPIAIGTLSDVYGNQTKDFRAVDVLAAMQQLRADAGQVQFDENIGKIKAVGTGPYLNVDIFKLFKTGRRIQLAVGMDFWFDTVITPKGPIGVFNISDNAGQNKSNAVEVTIGINAYNVEVVEDDDTANSEVTVYGGNGPWGGRPTAVAVDASIEEDLGGWPRPSIITRTDIMDANSLQVIANGNIRGRYIRTVVDITNKYGEWAAIRSGDIISVNFPGFTADKTRWPRPGRILGRRLDEVKGLQTLAVQILS